jgi:ribosomal protein S18 acetylase RimI-like enzyme
MVDFGVLKDDVDFRVLNEHEWFTLRNIRLTALKDSPDMFLATYDRELEFDEAVWRDEFVRGHWVIGTLDGKPMCLAGLVKAPEITSRDRYIEYMWVDPLYRRSRVAVKMLEFVFDYARLAGLRRIYLYVLDGNEPAFMLYKGVGFRKTKKINRLDAKPGRFERRMVRTLT